MARQSQRQTTEQRRAAEAWRCVREAAGKSDAFRKRYGTLARNLPTLIQVNGLGQTLAYVYAKANMPGRNRKDADLANEAIFDDLSKWVKPELGKADIDGNLLQMLLGQTSDFYRRATAEAMGFATWLRRFAEAELPTEEE